MRHVACHYSVTPLSRGKTASSVARAAYIGRCRFHDERTGQTHDYSRRGGLLAEGAVNWSAGIEHLWNEVERSETRKNARVAREVKVALPAELPLDEMRRLVHGYCCNLKDRYGLAANWVIHAPEFHDASDGRRVERRLREGVMDADEYYRILSDPDRTNRNFHAHLLMSTRRKDDDRGNFAEKIRCLDNVRTGPEEINAMRGDWELRANAALKRVGAVVRVDLRSYGDMAAAGDAPAGLVAQPHVGPKAAHGSNDSYQDRIGTRQTIRDSNRDLWLVWERRRALKRERARLEASERIATEREAARKKEAEAEKRRIKEAPSAREARDAARDAVHLSAPGGRIADIIKRVQQDEAMQMPAGEDIEIDPETYEREASTTPFEKAIKVRRKVRTRVRTKTG